jgi:hypothetical protein
VLHTLQASVKQGHTGEDIAALVLQLEDSYSESRPFRGSSSSAAPKKAFGSNEPDANLRGYVPPRPTLENILVRVDEFMEAQRIRPIDLFRSKAYNANVDRVQDRGFNQAGFVGNGDGALGLRGGDGAPGAGTDDYIDAGELQALLGKAGMQLRLDEAKAVVAGMDRDRNGLLDIAELTNELRNVRRARAGRMSNIRSMKARTMRPPALVLRETEPGFLAEAMDTKHKSWAVANKRVTGPGLAPQVSSGRITSPCKWDNCWGGKRW